MSSNQYYQRQQVQMTPAVKLLLFTTVAVWILFQLIGDRIHLFSSPMSEYLGLHPIKVIERFYIWQVFTYMFLHANFFHVLLNMLSLWFIGSELEQRWGKRFFLFFYFSSGVGAALFYCLGVAIYTVITGNQGPLRIPVVGASGAIFGLLLAYGLLFGERTLHFMMLFPMKAKVFILILAGVEIVSLLDAGVSGGEVANLAHLGGFLSGFLTLAGYTRWQRFHWNSKSKKKGRNLRLIVDNESSEKKTGDGPKYWN
jgi:membrane associated rhomboid family serine protease